MWCKYAPPRPQLHENLLRYLADQAGFKVRLRELEAEEAHERNDPVAEKKANEARDQALAEEKAANRRRQKSRRKNRTTTRRSGRK